MLDEAESFMKGGTSDEPLTRPGSGKRCKKKGKICFCIAIISIGIAIGIITWQAWPIQKGKLREYLKGYYLLPINELIKKIELLYLYTRKLHRTL